jgi:hypothetical protein
MSIRLVRLNAVLLFALSLASAGAGQARDIRTERVAFATGTPRTVIEGTITGGQIVDYVLGAAAGRTLSVDMRTSNASSYFNILPSGSDEAMFVGSSGGTVADVPVPTAGDYVIRVYLMRSAARRNETARYSLAVGVGPPDFADGLAGGPDYWKVAGVGGNGLLNVRGGPSTRYPVVGKLQNGDVLRNDGCRMSGDERWCQIRATGSGRRGWVAGRFLIEAAPPRAASMPEGGPVGNGTPFDATGSVPCSTAAGQPTRPCLFGVVRDGPGNAGIWIGLGDGTERQILFERHVPVATDSGAALSFDKKADLFLIRIGEERYEIPSAVLDGG